MDIEEPILVRPMKLSEIPAVAELVRRSFEQAVAPLYSEEGQGEFMTYAHPQAMEARFDLEHFCLVALAGERLVGMIEVRRPEHISMLFVDPDEQRRGVGRRLLEQAVELMRRAYPDLEVVTVNASPNGAGAYLQFGFEPDGSMQEKNGIRFQPMRLRLPAALDQPAG